MSQDALFAAEEATASLEELIAGHVAAGSCATTMVFKGRTFLCAQDADHDDRHLFNVEAGARGLVAGIEDPRASIVRRIARRQVKSTEKGREVSVAIAHSLAFDPHVDGYLRLTASGRQLLIDEGT